ncbi:MAG TPA: OmpH family outer membrane protein [Fimbriimonas sp.]
MNQSRFQLLGWFLFVATFGVFVATGFQDNTTKIGVVDISKVVENSDFGKQNQETFNAMKKSREDLLEFIDTYRVLTPEQATQLRDISLKPNPSKEESATLETTKASIVASNKKWQELSTKTNLTQEDRVLIEDYAKRSQTMNEVAQRWFREFTNDMQTWADKQKLTSIEKARASIQEVAKAQGYSVVFEVGVAPYGANDLSDAALAKMNEKK